MHRENVSDNPTKDELHALFEYRDGVIYTRRRQGSLKAGKAVGSINSNGYLVTSVNKRPIRVHRLIFLMHYGYLPPMLDHINGNKLDNRIENLRAATPRQNHQNRDARVTNTSGERNVVWHKRSERWRVVFWAGGKQRQFGTYTDFTHAVQRARQIRKELHGEFARI